MKMTDCRYPPYVVIGEQLKNDKFVKKADVVDMSIRYRLEDNCKCHGVCKCPQTQDQVQAQTQAQTHAQTQTHTQTQTQTQAQTTDVEHLETCEPLRYHMEPDCCTTLPYFIPGPQGCMGPPGERPTYEPACYSQWIDVNNTDPVNVKIKYAGGPCILEINDTGFIPTIIGRYIVGLSAYVQVDGKYIVSMKLASLKSINIFGTGQVVSHDGDVVSSQGVVGLNRDSMYTISLRVEPLTGGEMTFENPQRITVNAYFILV